MVHSACNKQPSFGFEAGEAYLALTFNALYLLHYTSLNRIFSIQNPVYITDILFFPSFLQYSI